MIYFPSGSSLKDAGSAGRRGVAGWTSHIADRIGRRLKVAPNTTRSMATL